MATSTVLLGIELTLRGRGLTVARPRYEWKTDITNPELLAAELKRQSRPPDLFTFAQRLPKSKPAWPEYHWEWDNVAAIPVSTYGHWFSQQLHRNPRNKIKKAEKQGLEVRIVPFDDTLIAGIKSIHDEVPVRQGRPYVHYRKSLEAVRKGYETFLGDSTFIGAFFRGEMVGFLKLVTTDRFARSMGLLTKNKFRELAPMNALIAKAVDICAAKNMPYLVYGRYDYGKVGANSVIDFKYYNGFEHILLPRYYIPLTARGRTALSLGLHNGLVERLPKFLVQALRGFKVSYYEWRYRAELAASFAADSVTPARN